MIAWKTGNEKRERKSSVIPESELLLLDRSLLVGDIVKMNPRDSMSGRVVGSSMRVTLRPPIPWPTAVSRHKPPLPEEARSSNSLDESSYLRDVPSYELIPSTTWESGNFVVYRDWAGRIENVEDEITLRLGDGSLVVVADPSDIIADGMEPPYENDFVRTKKSNLRRGRWIFGAYNPNIDPSGHIARVRILSMGVRWLGCRLWLPDKPPEVPVNTVRPPYVLDEDILESGAVRLYDRSATVLGYRFESAKGNDTADMLGGDRVRFKDLGAAASKYPLLQPVPKTSSLGLDINTFIVAATKTEVTVLWQDLTTTTCASTSLIPYIDLDSNEKWPTDMVLSREAPTKGLMAEGVRKFGVVQTVDSKERTATIRWMGEMADAAGADQVHAYNEDIDTSGMLETLSMYELTTHPALARQLGDFVLVVPIHEQDGYDWCGMIVGLGLDGTVTVRLGASETPKDIQVPFQAAYVLFAAADEAQDEEDMMSEYESVSEDEDMISIDENEIPWRNENDEIVEEGDGQGWTTDDNEDEDVEDKMAEDKGEQNMEEGEGADVEMQDTGWKKTTENGTETGGAKNGIAATSLTETGLQQDAEQLESVPKQHSASTQGTSSKAFSYSTMFADDLAPPGFEILEGAAPDDHHFSDRTSAPDSQRLRRITKEHRILRSSLPDGVFVRTWEGSLDLMRVLILGPLETPYELAPFVIDLCLANFPRSPPEAFFHSFTDGRGPINPNLYEDGKICLSLLGTWPGDDKRDTWSPANSTILQVLVSLLGLVLVREPYFSPFPRFFVTAHHTH